MGRSSHLALGNSKGDRSPFFIFGWGIEGGVDGVFGGELEGAVSGQFEGDLEGRERGYDLPFHFLLDGRRRGKFYPFLFGWET